MGVTRVLDLDGLQGLIDALAARGHTVVGPTVRDGAVVHGRIARVDDLPRGWGDEQDAGHYRLRTRDDDALFGYAAGPQAAKPVLFPAEEVVWRGRRDARGLTIEEAAPRVDGPGGGPPYALLGVRACDLAAYVGTWFAALARAQAVDVTAVLVLAALVTATLAGVRTEQIAAADLLWLGVLGLGGAVLTWSVLRDTRAASRPLEGAAT